MSDLSVAAEIAKQIGHRAFQMMGTNQKMGDDNSLTFNIKGSKAYNKIKITLTPADLYDITFYKIGGSPNFLVRKEVTLPGIHAEDLHRVIEQETGLYLSL